LRLVGRCELAINAGARCVCTAGSAAARAGVMIGDKLIAIDNVNVLHASLEKMRQLIPSSKFHIRTISLLYGPLSLRVGPWSYKNKGLLRFQAGDRKGKTTDIVNIRSRHD